MSPPSRQDVLAEIARRFPSEQRTAVVKALNFYGARPSEPERERVQLAILEQSNGDADKLHSLVEQAKQDYRSVLGEAAEAPSERPAPVPPPARKPPVFEDAPRWFWIFVGMCLFIPVLTWGGLIPIVVGVGGALWCRQIAWNFDLLRRTRFIYCAGVTLLCYGVLTLVLTGMTHV